MLFQQQQNVPSPPKPDTSHHNNASPHHYQFLSDDIKLYEKKLRVLFCNYLLLAQYELARAMIHQIHDTIDSEYALFLLQCVIERPDRLFSHLSSSSSSSSLSTQHNNSDDNEMMTKDDVSLSIVSPKLVWFCYSEYCQLKSALSTKQQQSLSSLQSSSSSSSTLLSSSVPTSSSTITTTMTGEMTPLDNMETTNQLKHPYNRLSIRTMSESGNALKRVIGSNSGNSSNSSSHSSQTPMSDYHHKTSQSESGEMSVFATINRNLFIVDYEQRRSELSHKYTTVLLEFELLLESLNHLLRDELLEHQFSEQELNKYFSQMRHLYRSILYSGKKQSLLLDPTAFVLSSYSFSHESAIMPPNSMFNLSAGAMSLLKQICVLCPDLGVKLGSMLCVSETPVFIFNQHDSKQEKRTNEVNSSCRLDVELQHSHILMINSCIDKDKYSDAAFVLRYLNISKDMEHLAEYDEVMNNLNSVFLKMANYCLSMSDTRPISQKRAGSIRKLIYESLLVHEDVYLLSKYCSIEESIISKLSIDDLFVNQNGTVNSDQFSMEHDFWIPFINYIRITDNHFLEAVMQACLTAIKDEDFDRLKLLVNPPHLANLKPLIILLSWDILPNIKTKRMVFEVLWPTKTFDAKMIEDELINFSCNELAYHLNLSVWASKQISDVGLTPYSSNHTYSMRYSIQSVAKVQKLVDAMKRTERSSYEKSIEAIGNAILSALTRHSITYILFPWIPYINEEELFSLLKRRTIRRSSNADSPSRTHVRKELELVLLQSYSIMNKFLKLTIDNVVKPSGKHENEIIQTMREIQNDIEQMEPLIYRLIVLENMMNMLFLKKKQLKVLSEPQHGTFIADSLIIREVLSLFKTCISGIQDKDLSEEFQFRFQRFSNNVDDAIWRFQFSNRMLGVSTDGLIVSSGQDIIELMLASPATYLSMALKCKDFATAKDIFVRYKGDPSLEERRNSLKDFKEVDIAEFTSQSGNTGNIKADEVVEFSSLQHFYVSLDLVLRTDLTSKALVDLIYVASRKYQKLSGEDAHKNNFFNRLLIYQEHFPNTPMFDILSRSYKYPKSPASLDNALTVEETKTKQLKELLSAAKNPQQDFDEQLLSIDEQYLRVFMQHLFSTHKVVSRTQHADVFSLSNRSPMDMIADLVFISSNYTDAQDLAQLNKIILPRLIVDLCADESSNSRKLTLEVASYLCDRYELVGILSCLLLTTSSSTQGELLDYSMQQMSKHVFLSRWSELRTSLFKDLVHLNQPTSVSSPRNNDLPSSDSEHDENEDSDVSEPEPVPLGEKIPSPEDVQDDVVNFNHIFEQVSSESSHHLSLINLLDFNDDAAFHTSIIQRLIDQGNINAALNYANKGVVSRIPDFMIQLFVEQTSERHVTANLIHRIEDDKLATTLVFKHLESWDIDTAIQLTQMCVSRLDSNKNSIDQESLMLRSQAQQKLSQLLLYRGILASHLGSSFVLWTDLNETAEREAHKLVSDLVEAKEFTLAKSAASLLLEHQHSELEDFDSVLLHIEQEYALHALRYEYETRSHVLRHLCSLEPQSCITVCKYVIEKLDDYKKKLFLCEFLITSMREHLSPSQLEQYQATLNGMRVLRQMSREMQEKFEHLLYEPELIIENLLLLQDISSVESILNHVPELRDDSLIISYGKKALDIHTESDNGESKDPQNPMLSDDEQHNQSVRANHRYAQAPSMLLAKSIFDLCSQPRKVGKALIVLCDTISQDINAKRKTKIDLVQQMIQYAKLSFLRDPQGHDQLSVCDTLTSHIELLKLISYKDININVSLSDFRQQSRARQIRDQLLNLDQIQLALNVATRCQIESEPVWTQWGLSLLSFAKYKLARQKLKYCFSLSPAQKQALLSRILLVLEGAPSSKQILDHLKQVGPNFLMETIPDDRELYNLNPLYTHLDPHRFKEAKYYIRKLGTNNLYIAFLLRNGKLEDAIYATFDMLMPQSFFVETIVSFCLRNGIITDMLTLIEKYENHQKHQQQRQHQESSATRSHTYLTATCKLLNERQAFNILYQVQLFMKDDIRAGLTCIRLFMMAHPPDVELKLKHLDTAKKHFQDGMMQSHDRHGSPSKPVLKVDEIAKYLKTINLQIEETKSMAKLTSTMTDTQQQLSYMKLSLFESAKSKCEIAEILLLSHFDLAFRIITEFNLPHVKLYVRTLTLLIRKKKPISVMNDLLQNIQSTPLMHDDDWDMIMNAIIKLYVNEINDVKTAEKFISKLRNDSRKIKACLLCKRYKAAYLIAASSANAYEDVKLIYSVTSQIQDSAEAKQISSHCLTFLKKR